jgi:hypothetical protein
MSLAGATFANQRHNPLYIELLDSLQFYAAGECVRGKVRVDPKTKPTHIAITFKGYSVIHNKDAHNVTIDFFNNLQDLFESTGAGENFDILRRGSAQDGKVELPFEFTFPLTVKLPPPSDRTWWYSKDLYNHPRFQHSPGFPLPPTCSPLLAITGPLTPRIVYYLEARMESSLPDGPSIIRQELTYLPPAPNYEPMLLQPDLNFGVNLPKHLCHYTFVRTRKLYPDYANRSKASKIRDVLVDKELFFGLETFGEIPHCRFNYFATPARVLVLGAHVPIVMTVQHLERSESLTNPPALFLRRVRVQLLSAFNIFVPNPTNSRNNTKESVDVARATTVLMDRKFDKGQGHPFVNGMNLSDLGGLILKGHDKHKLLPSFTSYGLALEYELQVDVWGECADREFAGLACKERVQVVTNYQVTAAPPGIAELEDPPPAEPGPEYHEFDPMAAVHGMDGTARRYDLPPSFMLDSRPVSQLTVNRAVPPPPYRYA